MDRNNLESIVDKYIDKTVEEVMNELEPRHVAENAVEEYYKFSRGSSERELLERNIWPRPLPQPSHNI